MSKVRSSSFVSSVQAKFIIFREYSRSNSISHLNKSQSLQLNGFSDVMCAGFGYDDD